MDWKAEAINKLKQFEQKRKSLDTLPMEIKQLESSMDSIKSAQAVMITGKSHGNGPEQRFMECIMQREELQRNYERCKLWVNAVSGALDTLNSEERKILDRFFIHEQRGAAEDLAEEFFVDRKTIYYRKDTALWKFTVALYGCMAS